MRQRIKPTPGGADGSERAAAADAMARLAGREVLVVENDMRILYAVMSFLEQNPDTAVVAGFAKLPIVALTAKASDSDRQRCIAAGCDAFLAKPADTRELSSVLLQHVPASGP